MKKLFEPKRLAIMTIIMMILSSTVLIVSMGGLIMPIIYGNIYIIIYLTLLLLGKNKNYNKLNTILAIQMAIPSILTFWLVSTIKLDSIIFISLTITIIGIIFTKKMPYKSLMIIGLIISVVTIIYDIYCLCLGTISFNMNVVILEKGIRFLSIVIYDILFKIGLVSFIIFMYQYAISFYKGGVSNNE